MKKRIIIKSLLRLPPTYQIPSPLLKHILDLKFCHFHINLHPHNFTFYKYCHFPSQTTLLKIYIYIYIYHNPNTFSVLHHLPPTGPDQRPLPWRASFVAEFTLPPQALSRSSPGLHKPWGADLTAHASPSRSCTRLTQT